MKKCTGLFQLLTQMEVMFDMLRGCRSRSGRFIAGILATCGCVAFLGACEVSENADESPSGSPVSLQENSDRDIIAPEQHARNLEDIEAHLEKHIGPTGTVLHEVISDRIHIDIIYIPPTSDRPFAVLATSGVSDLPMAVPEGAEQLRRAELLIALPLSWPISDEAFKDESNYWPVRWLKYAGRLPHEYATWIGWGHTIPNNNPPEPIADTNFVGVMLSRPYWLDEEFLQLTAASGDVISFYEMIPLYSEEMDLKLAQGAEELERKFDKENIGFVLDVARRNVAK